MSWTKDYLRAKIFLSRKKFNFTMEMLFIVTLFTAIAKTRFSGLKRSSATILFHTYRKFDVNLPKTPSFRKKNASFIENNLPFVDIMFLSRKEAKGSTFRCLAIPLFRSKFFNMDELVSNPNISPSDYKDLYPLFLCDVSKQSERLKYSVTDIQIKAFFDGNVNANTDAYAVIVSDRLIDFQSDGNKMSVVS